MTRAMTETWPAVGRLPANPFATRHTRPGAVPPLDGRGEPLDVAALADRCLTLPAAALEGPHGHGKTTTLVALVDHLATRGVPVDLVRLRTAGDGRRTLAAVLRGEPGAVVCIDGWERISRLAAVVIRLAARWRRVRLVVTTHRPAGMPVVLRCSTSAGLLAAIVARLPDHGGRIADADVVAAFARHGGDLRESLYDLYDRFEQQIR
jgi:hypothetical protein